MEENPGTEKPASLGVQALAIDRKLANTFKFFLLETSKDGTKENALMTKIDDAIIGNSVGAAVGSALMNVLWRARQISKDLGYTEKRVLTAMCAVMLETQHTIETKKQFSSN